MVSAVFQKTGTSWSRKGQRSTLNEKNICYLVISVVDTDPVGSETYKQDLDLDTKLFKILLFFQSIFYFYLILDPELPGSGMISPEPYPYPDPSKILCSHWIQIHNIAKKLSFHLFFLLRPYGL
jgi:hypothetical protein